MTAGNCLTERQMQVLALVADGLTNPEIGARLWLTVNTVRTHIVKISASLGARDRAHCVHLAHQRRFLCRAAAPRPIRRGWTLRERQVIALAADGTTNPQIAAALRVELATVKTLMDRARIRIDARNRAQLVHLAHQQGVLPLAADGVGSGKTSEAGGQP